MAAAKKGDTKTQKNAKAQKTDKPAKKKEAKKWGKTSEKNKAFRSVTVTKTMYDKIKKDVSGSNMVSPATLASKNNIVVSLAKKLLKEFEEEGLIQVLTKSSFTIIYGKRDAASEKAELKPEEAGSPAVLAS